MNDNNHSATQQYLTFAVAGEEYAVAILRVREIIAFDEITRVPRTPDFIRGVINLRGGVVPVIDVAQKFGYGQTTPVRSSCIVIVEVELAQDGEAKTTVLGLLVDAVSQVVDLRLEDIQEPPSFGTQVDIGFLIGMGRAASKFVLLLDIDKVVAATDVIAAVQSAESPAAEESVA